MKRVKVVACGSEHKGWINDDHPELPVVKFEASGRWSVVHEPSSFIVCGTFKKRDTALFCAGLLAEQNDWTAPYEQAREWWEDAHKAWAEAMRREWYQ